MSEFINLPEGTFRVLCVGNISVNKNQKMLVDAFKVLDSEILKKSALIVIGGKEEELRQYTEQNKIEKVYFTGSLLKKDVYEYMKTADLIFMSSLNEGFGLPVAEGYSFGVPSVIPIGVDAYYELYNDDVSVSVNEYTPEAFANAVKTAYERQWNKEKIIEFSKKFSMENCSREYLAFLREASTLGKSPVTRDELKKLVISCE